MKGCLLTSILFARNSLIVTKLFESVVENISTIGGSMKIVTSLKITSFKSEFIER